MTTTILLLANDPFTFIQKKFKRVLLKFIENPEKCMSIIRIVRYVTIFNLQHVILLLHQTCIFQFNDDNY